MDNHMIDYTKKNWDSLSAVMASIKKEGKENVVSFDGIYLTTNKATYGLADGKVSRVEK